MGGEKLTRDGGPPVEGAVSAIWEQPKWAEGKVLLPVALSCAPECRLPESPPRKLPWEKAQGRGQPWGQERGRALCKGMGVRALIRAG